MPKESTPYGKIVKKTWRKERFKNLSDQAKLLLCYLWSHPDGHSPAIIPVSFDVWSFDLNWKLKVGPQVFSKICSQGWVIFDKKTRMCYFPKWFDYTPPTNPPAVVWHLKYIMDLQPSVLVEKYLQSLQPFMDKFGITYSEANGVQHGVQPKAQHRVQLRVEPGAINLKNKNKNNLKNPPEEKSLLINKDEEGNLPMPCPGDELLIKNGQRFGVEKRPVGDPRGDYIYPLED